MLKKNAINYSLFIVLLGSVLFTNNAQAFTLEMANQESIYNRFPVIDPEIVSRLEVRKLESDFLKNSTEAQNIINQGIAIDLDNYNLWNSSFGYDRNNFGYKIYSAFSMIGYTNYDDTIVGTNKLHVTFLNRFQKDYNFPVSSTLDRDVLFKIDEILLQYEAKYANYASTFPLYNHMAQVHPNEASQDYIATLFYLPIKVLPNSIKIKTEYQFIDCIKGQCYGSITDASGNPPTNWDPAVIMKTNYVFNHYFPLKNSPYMPYNGVNQIWTTLHEYAHYLDGSQYGTSTLTTQGSIQIKSFSQISFINISGICADHKTGDSKEFISYYGYKPNYSNTICSGGQYLTVEDFAESFAAYVASGNRFRLVAKNNKILQQKYNWLKKNVFNGREYDTDMPFPVPAGCNFNGYSFCDANYVWDGNMRIL